MLTVNDEVYSYLIYEKRTVLEGHDTCRLKRIKKSFIFCPGDEIYWRFGLNVTQDHAPKTFGNVLDSLGEVDPGWN